MARYIQWNDVTDRYADAAKHAAGAESMKTNYINGAEDEVDARCAVRYTTPFTPVPGIIRDLCVDLAYFKLTVKQRDPDEDSLKKYIDERFEGILNGTILLTTSGTVLGAQEQAWSSGQDFSSSFGVDDVTNWSVSSNWQQDFEDRRE